MPIIVVIRPTRTTAAGMLVTDLRQTITLLISSMRKNYVEATGGIDLSVAYDFFIATEAAARPEALGVAIGSLFHGRRLARCFMGGALLPERFMRVLRRGSNIKGGFSHLGS